MVVLGGLAVSYERGTPVRREHTAKSAWFSVALTVGSTLCPYGIACRRLYGLSALSLSIYMYIYTTQTLTPLKPCKVFPLGSEAADSGVPLCGQWIPRVTSAEVETAVCNTVEPTVCSTVGT